jgi:N-ethylmaleimide reductase
MGRVSHPDYHNGQLPVAPSAIPAVGMAHTPTGKQPYVAPRELTAREIADIVNDYAIATSRARKAGFDGVEIHGANSYLIDQFLRDGSNQRTDQYGGTIENRLRFLREVVEAVISAWSPGRTGLRLSPTMNGNGMSDSDPVRLFTQVARAMNDYKLAYLHTAEAIRPGRLFNPDIPRVTPRIREVYQGTLITNGSHDKTSAAESIRNGDADAIAFGQLFISNPDLPLRFQLDDSLNEPNPDTFYSPGAHGYTDYPAIHEYLRRAI